MAQQIKIERYKNNKQYQQAANKWARKGWAVQSVTSEQPRSGCGRILALGIFAAIFRPKPILIVTYVKA